MKLLKIRFTAKIYEQKILITTLFIKKRIGLEVHEKNMDKSNGFKEKSNKYENTYFYSIYRQIIYRPN